MKAIRVAAAAGLCLSWFAAAPATAQVQLNVCGVPPLPPCEPPRERRVIIEREVERPVRAFGTLCRTRTMRCRIDEPRPIGARCLCEDDDGEEIVGRIVR